MALNKTLLQIDQVSGGLSLAPAVFSIKYGGDRDDWVTTNTTDGGAMMDVLSPYGVRTGDYILLHCESFNVGNQRQFIGYIVDIGYPALMIATVSQLPAEI